LRFSSDGRVLAFAASTNLATFTQVYLADLLTGTNFLLSQAYDTHAAAGASSDSVDISSDGRFVAFRSGATNIVPGDTNGARDIFLFDRQTASTVLLSSSRLGNWPANNRSMSPVFSGDGRTLVFQSWASDIVSGDFNHYCDLLMFDLYASSPIPLYARITPNATPGQLPVLTWPVIPGKSYRVQFKSALGDSQWQELSGGVSVVGNQGYFNDPTTLATQRYYRIVAY
jgi:dipeptidyl aminopeptidase/acylaminoacyl peptidase